jgi:ribosomal protein S18 acetylase RimI-like enzyme
MTAAAQVRPMTQDEFEAWEVAEVAAYAADLARSTGADPQEALRLAADQHDDLLPDGLATDGMHLLRVLDADGEPVGVLWVGPHPRRSDAGWVYDVHIDEPRRGEGLGRAAMLAAEGVAVDAGWTALGLNVFGHNPRARGLYDSLGYEVASTSMVKPLAAAAPPRSGAAR